MRAELRGGAAYVDFIHQHPVGREQRFCGEPGKERGAADGGVGGGGGDDGDDLAEGGGCEGFVVWGGEGGGVGQEGGAEPVNCDGGGVGHFGEWLGGS